MKSGILLKVVACLVLAAPLAGCFEPSGKNFEGKWVREGDHSSDPQKLDISCSGGYCDFVIDIWDFGEGKRKPEFSRPKIKEERVLSWEGLPLAAYFEDGKIHYNGRVYIRRK
uniref:hypothetical protein n=1 Tax=Pseudomonas aeruginosa TaxID=287 RepID=UPI0029C91977|nr:hypothetical protein [Pseudomonas aeruginosa]